MDKIRPQWNKAFSQIRKPFQKFWGFCLGDEGSCLNFPNLIPVFPCLEKPKFVALIEKNFSKGP